MGPIASLLGTAIANKCGVRAAEIRNLASFARKEAESASSIAFVVQKDR